MAITLVEMLKAKKLHDLAKREKVGLWWDSVRFFSTWNDDCRNKQWSDLPEGLKHEVIGIHDSLPTPERTPSLYPP